MGPTLLAVVRRGESSSLDTSATGKFLVSGWLKLGVEVVREEKTGHSMRGGGKDAWAL